MALYHKYRPQKFLDLVGQDHIREILTNALRQGRLGHAYLLAGPRGLGKTTTARLLAKSVNCLKNEQDKSQPCNDCQLCQEITLGSSLDVIEIDAASNRGIDEIRELRDKIKFAPTMAAKKVFIIDEVHMLTKEAFNALLKTLEEPPSHALFILATTEPHKVPETILSRLQRFDFHRASIKDLKDYLFKISHEEKVEVEPEALAQLAQLAQGSFRDGLVLLDQVISSGKTKINLKTVLAGLGLASLATVKQFISSLEKQDLSKALEIIDELSEKGHNLETFVELVITQLRRELRTSVGTVRIGWIEPLLKALEQMNYAPDQKLPLELALYKLGLGVKKKTSRPDHQPKPARTSEKIDIHTGWPKLIQAIRAQNVSLASFLSSGVLGECQEGKIQLLLKYQFYQDLIEKPANCQLVEKIGLQVLGMPIKLECKLDPGQVLEQEKKQDEELIGQVDQILG